MHYGIQVFIFVSLWVNGFSSTGKLEFEYHDYNAVERYLQSINEAYPNITELYSIGMSVQNRNLSVIAISGSPGKHVPLRPDVKLVANIHGNEVTGREVLLHFTQRLVREYGTNVTITDLLDTTRIHILVSMNPDGFQLAYNRSDYVNCGGTKGRANANGFDLNRNFPDEYRRDDVEMQPETKAVIDWMKKFPFILSACFHDGSLVANYPYDNNRNSTSISLDDDVLQHLARTYSFAHTTMHKGDSCGKFKDGITNGAEWYSIYGGMQDYNFVSHSCLELTLELSCCKFSQESELEKKWKENKEAMVAYLSQAHIGVKGIISDEQGKPIQGASVGVEGRNHPFNTTEAGEYWRLLLPGHYRLQVKAKGYKSIVSDFEVKAGPATIHNVTLTRKT